MLAVVVAILIVILLLSFCIMKIKGGYDYSLFKPADKQPNVNDCLKCNIGQDKYFKSLLYRNYKSKVFGTITVRGFVPAKIKYIQGGFSDIKTISDIAKQRLAFTPEATYEPDFVIQVTPNKYLILEFDEGNEYHQDATDFRYQAKNLIYSEMLHSYEEDQSIVIMRICYNSGVNKCSEKSNDYRKKDTDHLTIKGVDAIINRMIEDRISNQYVLMKLEADSTGKKQEKYRTYVTELVGVKAKEGISCDAENHYSYFNLNLNDRIPIKEDTDRFIVTNYFKKK